MTESYIPRYYSLLACQRMRHISQRRNLLSISQKQTLESLQTFKCFLNFDAPPTRPHRQNARRVCQSISIFMYPVASNQTLISAKTTECHFFNAGPDFSKLSSYPVTQTLTNPCLGCHKATKTGRRRSSVYRAYLENHCSAPDAVDSRIIIY